jgi:hypothetical protein
MLLANVMGFGQTQAPGTGFDNKELAALMRSQAPPKVNLQGPGRVVLDTLAPLEGALIQLGGTSGAQLAVVSSSMGASWTPELGQLTERKSIL